MKVFLKDGICHSLRGLHCCCWPLIFLVFAPIVGGIKKQEAQIADIKLALDLETQNALVQIRNALITVDNQMLNKELAEKVLRNIEHNYKNGLATLTDLIDAESSYTNAQNEYTAAIVDYKLAEIQLKKAKGALKKYYTE